MIRRLLCWLGFHKWESIPHNCSAKDICEWFKYSGTIVCSSCPLNDKKCKYCGKIKNVR